MAINSALPTRNADGTAVVTPSRTGSYGEAYVLPMGGGNWLFADEGTYYHASNPTLATGIAGHAAPVVADTDTKALLHIFNGNTANKSIYLDYLFLEVTAAGTGGTLHYTTIYIDQKGATALASGGSTITPVNVKSGGNAIPSGIITTFGACATSAMASSVKVGQQIVREVIPVVQDTVVMKFGGPNAGAHAGLTTAGTATNHLVQHFCPIVIAPGGNLNISQIRPSQSAAASYQFSLGFWVR